MTNHCDNDRRRAALCAAGALDESESRAFRRHAASCPACAADLAQFEALSGALRALPPASTPVGLAARTRIRAAEELARRIDRSVERTAIGTALVVSWIALGVTTFAAVRLSDWTPRLVELLPGGLLPWVVTYFAASWTAAASVAVWGQRAVNARS